MKRHLPSPDPKLYAGEQLDTVAGFPTLYNFFPADPQKPLVVFIPGNLHNARIAYGGHQGYEQRDFLAYWLNSHGHGLLAISYPLDSEPAIMPATAPHFRIPDWGKQAAQVTHSVIKTHGLSSQVVVTGWSMGSRIVVPYTAEAQSLGIDVVLYVSLAGYPAIHGLWPALKVERAASGYAGVSHIFQLFTDQMQEEEDQWNGGRVIIPYDIYLREYCGHAPVGLADYHLRYDRDSESFVRDDWTSMEEAAIDRAQHCPMIAALTGTSSLDAGHVVTDQATWTFVLTRKLMHEIDAHDLSKVVDRGNWSKLIDLVHSVSADISYLIPGNHFFFVGESGASETAAVIVKHLEKVRAFRHEFEELLES